MRQSHQRRGLVTKPLFGVRYESRPSLFCEQFYIGLEKVPRFCDGVTVLPLISVRICNILLSLKTKSNFRPGMTFI